MKRVAITGIGIVSCLGNNQDEVYKSLLNTKSGIKFSEEYKNYNFKSQICGTPDIKIEDHIDRKFIRFMGDRKSTRLNSSHVRTSRMPSSA